MGYLHLTAEDHAGIGHGSGPARLDDSGSARVGTQIHQRLCSRCQRWFWAWTPTRHKCFICDPLAPDQLKRLLDSIHAPNGQAHETSVSSS
jgi:hypothetical protein